MRVALLSLVAFVVLLAPLHSVSAATPASGPHLVAMSYQENPVKDFKVDIDVNTGGGGRVWYANPMWIAIGAVAFLLFIAIIVMAARGGGTTIVKE